MRILYSLIAVLTISHTAHAGAIGLVRDIRDELGIFVVVGIALAMAVFMMGMISFLASSGDQSAHDKGRQRMIWGIIALFFMVSVWGIVNILQTLVGADLESGCAPIQIDVIRESGSYSPDPECL